MESPASRIRQLFIAATLLALATLHAQTPFQIQDLGRASTPITGPWQFHLGDDPAWSSPTFNDASWPTIETGRTWEEQGYPNHTGFAWYRRQIVLATVTNPNSAAQTWNLALLLPNVEDSAEVYWNGRVVGSFGRVPPNPVWYGSTVFPIVIDLGPINHQPRKSVLAIRVWKAPHAYLSFPYEGGLSATPILGSAEAIAGLRTVAANNWLRSQQYAFSIALLSSVVSLLALLAWLRDRRQWMLFWLAAYMARPLALLLSTGIPMVSWRVSYGTVGWIFSATDAALWFLLLYLLGLRDNRRLVLWTRIFAILTVGLQLIEGSLQFFDWTRAPHFFLLVDVGTTIPALLVQLWGVVLVLFAFRKRLDAARWLVAIAALVVDLVENFGSWFDLGERWTHWTFASIFESPLFTLAGNEFTQSTLATTALLIAVLYAVWSYEREQRLHQSHLDEEFRNAQELQQVLIPDTLPTLPGYSVTSAYRPAQEVGGDFFQLIPLSGEAIVGGSALVIVGDVSGKGLRAAMTVSLIVGALRSLAETTSDPAQILAGLNRRLYGRLHQGFATCLVLRLDPTGACTLSNAGHLPPFLNGQELALPGALPLGLSPIAAYEETTVRLAPNDRLTLYTDGLVEARNASGELYGFTRLTQLIATKPDATQAAEAAVSFGQDDDVTVLTLTREPVAARAQETKAIPVPAR
jgi:hypothetical protein